MYVLLALLRLIVNHYDLFLFSEVPSNSQNVTNLSGKGSQLGSKLFKINIIEHESKKNMQMQCTIFLMHVAYNRW